MRTVTYYNREEAIRLVKRGFVLHNINSATNQIDCIGKMNSGENQLSTAEFAIDFLQCDFNNINESTILLKSTTNIETKFLFYFIGRSGCGKDYMLNKVKDKLQCRMIREFTTRPIRDNEEINGRYIFTALDKYQELNPIEMRSYNVKLQNNQDDMWYYGTPESELLNFINSKDKYDHFRVASGSLEAYCAVANHINENKDLFANLKLIPIYIRASNDDLFEHLYNREYEIHKNGKKNYNELCRRWIKDNEDFSDQKVYVDAKIEDKNVFDNKFDNESVELVIEYCKAYYDTFYGWYAHLLK